MSSGKKTDRKREFGDFQTPDRLAREVCDLLRRDGAKPASLVEPTCGTGNFLLAALRNFTDIDKAIGLEINGRHLEQAICSTQSAGMSDKVRFLHADFFDTNWTKLLRSLPEPVLVIGNPPWVTNAELGSLNSTNLPDKVNSQKHSGLDAITGKSNFDICEWMLQRLFSALNGRSAIIAMLCKTTVARKVLSHAWKQAISLKSSAIYRIDAAECFGASVDACLLVCRFLPGCRNQECSVHQCLTAGGSSRIIGYRDGSIIADSRAYNRWKHLEGSGGFPWRSGIKHDCVKIMELTKNGEYYSNGLRDILDIEDTYIYPLLKSSDLSNGVTETPRRWMIVTQRTTGEDTEIIRLKAPKTWKYLLSEAERLDGRASRIYRGRSRFAIFGVGAYSFSPWKVAISGFQKRILFRTVGNFCGKPIVLDDTSYFLPCRTQEEAEYITSILNTNISKEFFDAFVFWDAKRPITRHLLRRLNLTALAKESGSEEVLLHFLSQPGQEAESLFQYCK